MLTCRDGTTDGAFSVEQNALDAADVDTATVVANGDKTPESIVCFWGQYGYTGGGAGFDAFAEAFFARDAAGAVTTVADDAVPAVGGRMATAWVTKGSCANPVILALLRGC